MRWIAVILLASVVQAGEPVARITGPRWAQPGDEILLSAEKSSDATLYRWDVRAGSVDGYEHLDPDGVSSATVQMRSYAGVYVIQLIVANGESISSPATHIIRIGGRPPAPLPEPDDDTPVPVPPGPMPPHPDPPEPPDPDPQPQPDPDPPAPPDVPVGEFGISRPVAEISKRLLDAETAKRIAGEIEALASAIAAGALSNHESGGICAQDLINKMLKTGDVIDSFALRTAIAPELARVYQEHGSGRLKTRSNNEMVDPAAWQKLLTEIAVGLRGR